MRNILLDHRTRNDIDAQVGKVHRDLAYKSGKVELAEVRDLLRLDLRYYQLDDPSVLDGVVHRLRIGAKQVFERPSLLIEAVRKFDLKALFVPDQKRIFIDGKTPDLKKRWSESHEVSHSLIPWHADYMFGDDGATLSPSCHERIEAEANYGAGQLLFPPVAFHESRRSEQLSLVLVRKLAKEFGNTITSTLWRCVESSENSDFGLISGHPRYGQATALPVEHFIRSGTFADQFENVDEAQVWGLIRSYCGYQRVGPLGSNEVVIKDRTGTSYLFAMETFCVKYHTLTLGRLLRVAPIITNVGNPVVADTSL
ncbi:ImmA/IrrE family metallo-endopeptidase [Cognatiluteimonas telluris]|uniref:ImmA/IrrE family metallo-endopeptidase n=1 Tax=Cognatiluteimonas telluris TaxID=1104775 RepID=UPI001409F0F0|nr:ImmA/IrrE family metallo-endopeptidase [Lysobacter telluris]